MTKTYTLTNISQAVEIATELSGSWFRGHSKVYGNLTPGIFRENYEFIKQWRDDVEFYIIDAFKRGAPTLAANLPDQNDNLVFSFQDNIAIFNTMYCNLISCRL